MNLEDLNSNVVAGAVMVLGGVFGWLWKKATGERTQSLSELLDERLTWALDDALDDLDTSAAIERRLREEAAAVARSLGFDPKRHEQTIRIAVQWAMVEANRRLTERRRNQKAAKAIPAQLDKLAATAQAVVDEFKKLPPDKPINTLDEARAAGVELLEIGPDGHLVAVEHKASGPVATLRKDGAP